MYFLKIYNLRFNSWDYIQVTSEHNQFLICQKVCVCVRISVKYEINFKIPLKMSHNVPMINYDNLMNFFSLAEKYK